MVPLHNKFNGNEETDTSEYQRPTVKAQNIVILIMELFRKLSFMSKSVKRQNLKGAAALQSYYSIQLSIGVT